jgi:hypothetical protein
MNEYWMELTKIELGDTTRLFSWIDSLQKNVWKSGQWATRTEMKTDMDLNVLDESDNRDILRSIRYSVNSAVPHWIFRGLGMKELFDDWDYVHKQVTDLVGPCDWNFPSIIYTTSHIHRHKDRRLAAVNIGLYNSDKSCNLYWEGRELVASHNTDDSVAYLLRIHDTDHSMIQDDSRGGMMWPRAVLTWDVSTLYQDLVPIVTEKLKHANNLNTNI